MTQVFAIIVTYNGMQWYDRCLGSLLRTDIPVKVIVIDNASSDGSTDYIRSHFPKTIVIESSENLGFAKANNIGMRYALDHGADYVLLLNQDAWLVQPDTLSKMIDISTRHPEFALFSPMQLYGSGRQIVYESKQYGARNEQHDWISDCYFGNLQDLYEVKYICAASWLVPIRTLKTIGGFDPLFYHNGEDDNYLQRIHYHGFKAGICPLVSVCHDIEGRSKEYNANTLDWRKYLLINYCNINADINLDKVLKSRKKSILLQKLRFNRKLLKTSVPEYAFLKEMKDAILNSRATNKKMGENWL